MTSVSNSRRCALMNAYLTRIPCDLRRLPIGPPLVLTTLLKVSVKAWEVHIQFVMLYWPIREMIRKPAGRKSSVRMRIQTSRFCI